MESEVKRTFKTFHYQGGLHWLRGRRGVLSASGRPDIEVSSPPEFKGEPGLWTPEDLLVAALNSCLLMTFLAYAQREDVSLKLFACSADALLEHSEGKYRITQVTLKPEIVVGSEEDLLLARDLLDRAHRDCIISNSVRAAVNMAPQIRAAAQ